MQFSHSDTSLLCADPNHFLQQQLTLHRYMLYSPLTLVICLPRIAKQRTKDIQASSLSAPFHRHRCLAPRFFRIGIPICSSAMSIIALSSLLYRRTSSSSFRRRLTSDPDAASRTAPLETTSGSFNTNARRALPFAPSAGPISSSPSFTQRCIVRKLIPYLCPISRSVTPPLRYSSITSSFLFSCPIFCLHFTVNLFQDKTHTQTFCHE